METNMQRRCGDIVGNKARQISDGLMSRSYNPSGKVYRRSVTHDLTQAAVEAVEADRKRKRPGTYPGTKMARQIHWSDKRQAAGRRCLQCYCLSCACGKCDQCDVKQFTKGEPVWWPSQSRELPVVAAAAAAVAPGQPATGMAVAAGGAAAAAAVATVSAGATAAAADPDSDEDLEESAEETTELLEGDFVAIAHDDPEYEDFKYYLLRVGKPPPEGGWPQTLCADEPDFVAGDRVVRGVLLEPVSGKPGPGAYEPSEGYPVVTRVENIVVDQASELPRRACLVDGAASASAGTMSLTVEEDKRLLKLMPAE